MVGRFGFSLFVITWAITRFSLRPPYGSSFAQIYAMSYDDREKEIRQTLKEESANA